jgi:hypothetical protein
MLWELVSEGKVLLSIRVDHEFLDWLRARVSDHAVAQLDPFRDTTLNRQLQERWLTALRVVRQALDADIKAPIERRPRLPSNPDSRELIVQKLVKRELDRHPWWSLLNELITALELSVESGAVIRAFGD